MVTSQHKWKARRKTRFSWWGFDASLLDVSIAPSRDLCSWKFKTDFVCKFLCFAKSFFHFKLFIYFFLTLDIFKNRTKISKENLIWIETRFSCKKSAWTRSWVIQELHLTMFLTPQRPPAISWRLQDNFREWQVQMTKVSFFTAYDVTKVHFKKTMLKTGNF